MNFQSELKAAVAHAVSEIYGNDVPVEEVIVNPTRPGFEGDLTVVVFPFVKMAGKSPPEVASELGMTLEKHTKYVQSFSVVQGFLNLSFTGEVWSRMLGKMHGDKTFGKGRPRDEKVMVEFSSPNTNKPLHLGHIRNILLGWSMARIFEFLGHEVVKTQIVNDRGIAISKSMVGWIDFADGETPESSGMKGDKLVGKYYVEFNAALDEEYTSWQTTPEAAKVFEDRSKPGVDKQAFFKSFSNEYFNTYSALGSQTKEILRRWEQRDDEIVALWEKMNGWVYSGFDQTYGDLGVHFDKVYYESDTYLLGKEMVKKGLEKGIFFREDDGSVWVDLTDAGLDKKILLRSDGTSVYMTQDLGTAQMRHDDFGVDKMIYVVGDEQEYHFQVLFEIMKRLEMPFAEGLYHLSYGMVDLPTGKMKSREGTVVDADDLIDAVIDQARTASQERGEVADLPKAEQEEIFRLIGLGALKFFIIKVHPKKRMTFDPKASVDLQGQTGPYIQNAYVRIQSILRKANFSESPGTYSSYEAHAVEKEILIQLDTFPVVVRQAAREYDPSGIANYAYNLAKSFHRFYHDLSIIRAETVEARSFRLILAETVAQMLQNSIQLLGIEMPSRM